LRVRAARIGVWWFAAASVVVVLSLPFATAMDGSLDAILAAVSAILGSAAIYITRKNGGMYNRLFWAVTLLSLLVLLLVLVVRV